MTPVKNFVVFTPINTAGKIRRNVYNIDLSNPEFVETYHTTYTNVKNICMRMVFPTIFSIGHTGARAHARTY